MLHEKTAQLAENFVFPYYPVVYKNKVFHLSEAN